MQEAPEKQTSPDEGPAWSAKRREISTWLARQYPDLDALYRKAVDELYRVESPSWPYIVSHCVREIRNRLPDPFLEDASRFETEDRLAEVRDLWDNSELLSPSTDDEGTVEVPATVFEETRRLLSAYDRHEGKYREKASVFFQQEGGNEQGETGLDPVVARWAEVTDFFHKHAHVPEQTGERERQVSESLRQDFVSRFETFETFLLSFARRFSDVLDRVDEIVEETNDESEIDPELVEEATALLGHRQARLRFFQTIENPQWFDSLDEPGYFDEMPEPREREDGTYHPYWPQTEFLKVLADQEEYQGEVVSVLTDQLPSENMTFVEACAEIAQQLPPDQASLVADGIVDSYARPDAWMKHGLPSAIFDLAIDLAEEDPEAARYVLRQLLWLHEDGQEEEDEDEGLPFPRYSLKSLTPVDDHVYGEILEGIVDRLVPVAPTKAIHLLCELLQDAQYRTVTEAHDPPGDGSRAWWPRIEDNGSRHPRLRERIGFALRDACLRALEDDLLDLDEVVDELSSDDRDWAVFDRLWGFLLARYLDEASAHLDELLTDPGLYRRGRCPELAELLASRFADLDEGDREDLVDAFLEGPPPELIPEGVRDPGDEEDRRREFIGTWRRDWLNVIEEHLPPEAERRLSELEDEWGQAIELTGRAVEMEGGFRAIESGVEPGDLEGKDVSELVDFLNEWSPGEDELSAAFPGGAEEDLARAFQAHLEEQPAKFGGAEEELAPLRPVFLRKVFEAARNTYVGSFDTEAVRDLAQATLEKTEPAEDRPTIHLSVRKSLLRYVQDLLKDDPPTPTTEIRQRVWRIIEQASRDPDPSPREGAPVANDDRDAFGRAINSVRGTALENAIRYVLWIAREEGGGDPVDVGMEVAPNAEELIDRHVDPDHEQAGAVRSVLAVFLPQLHLVDPAWIAERIGDIFPSDESHRELWTAAWRSHVTHVRAYDDVFEMTEDQYRRAVQELGEDAAEDTPSGYERSLSNHILAFYGSGLVSLDEGSLARAFFQQARPAVREFAIRSAGRSLAAGDEEVPADVLDRYRQLWEWRRNASQEATGVGRVRELRGFISWLDIEEYEDGWLLDQLLGVAPNLDLDHRMHRLLEFLQTTAADYPEETSEILEHLIESGRTMNLTLEEERIGGIVHAIDEAGAEERAQEIVDQLLHRGCMWARDLLEAEEDGDDGEGTEDR